MAPVESSTSVVVSSTAFMSAADDLAADFASEGNEPLDLGALLAASFGAADEDGAGRALTGDAMPNADGMAEIAALEGLASAPMTSVDDTASVEIAFQNA